jgi:hypothetical protein
MSFQDIFEQVDRILEREQGIFIGVEHDDSFFNFYFKDMLRVLRAKHNGNIHLLLEFEDDMVQAQLKVFHQEHNGNARNFSEQAVESWIDNFIQKGGQPGLIPTIWSSYFGIPVKGVDVSGGRGSALLYEPSTSDRKVAEILKDRALYTGEDMAKNIRGYLQRIAVTAKYLVVGGCAHGDVAKKLNIKSINVITYSMVPNLQEVLQSQTLTFIMRDFVRMPDYTFFYNYARGSRQDANLKDIPTQSKLLDTQFLKNSHQPACILTFENLDEIKQIHPKVVEGFTLALQEKYTQARSGITTNWEKLLRMAAFNNNLGDVRYCIEILKIEINAADNNPLLQKTALHRAAESKHFSIVQYLVSRGANINLADGTNKTAKDYADGDETLTAILSPLQMNEPPLNVPQGNPPHNRMN